MATKIDCEVYVIQGWYQRPCHAKAAYLVTRRTTYLGGETETWQRHECVSHSRIGFPVKVEHHA